MKKIIVTAAGLGERFKNLGINIPKYKIIANNKPLFYWSLLSLKNFFNEEFHLIFRKEIYDLEFVKSWLEKLGITKYTVSVIDKITDGQASTVMEIQNLINDKDSILIWNIDTYLNPNSLNYEIWKDDGCIITTQAPGNRWSFAKLGSNNYVSEVSEKIRISDYISVGLYYFKSWKNFKNIYMNFKNKIKDKYKETYVCPMYQYLIDEGKKISIYNISPKDFICLGTPEEIDEFDHEWYKNNKIM